MASDKLCGKRAALDLHGQNVQGGRYEEAQKLNQPLPGIGRLNYTAITDSDFPIIQGTVLLAAMFIVVANIVVDVSYAFLDPRVRYR